MGEDYQDAPAHPDEAVASLVYRGPRSQREVDAILARLRAWRDRDRAP